MERVNIAEVEPVLLGGEIDQRGLSEPLGTTEMAINHYRIAPGEGFPGGLHAHADQEEVFIVLQGEATFETIHGEAVVGANDAIRFAPGEFQSGHNAGDRDLVAIGLGAPRDTTDLRIPFSCPACGHGDLQMVSGEGNVLFRCPDCGLERVPEPCPECGDRDLRATLDADRDIVVLCHGCGSEFDEPPLRE